VIVTYVLDAPVAKRIRVGEMEEPFAATTAGNRVKIDNAASPFPRFIIERNIS
jgi:hypothetical protein